MSLKISSPCCVLLQQIMFVNKARLVTDRRLVYCMRDRGGILSLFVKDIAESPVLLNAELLIKHAISIPIDKPAFSKAGLYCVSDIV